MSLGELQKWSAIVGGGISSLAAFLMFTACVLSWQHARKHQQHQQAIFAHILACLAFTDFLGSASFGAARMDLQELLSEPTFMRMDIFICVFSYMGSCLWTCVFAYNVVQAITDGVQRTRATWRRNAACLHVMIWIMSGLVGFLVTVTKEQWSTNPIIILLESVNETSGQRDIFPMAPETFRGDVALWGYRLFVFPMPICTWVFACRQYCRAHRRFEQLRRLAVDSIDPTAFAANPRDSPLLHSTSTNGPRDCQDSQQGSQGGAGSHTLADLNLGRRGCSRIDYRLLSYTFVYIIWTGSTSVPLLYTVFGVNMSHTLFVIGYLMVFEPLVPLGYFPHSTHSMLAQSTSHATQSCL